MRRFFALYTFSILFLISAGGYFFLNPPADSPLSRLEEAALIEAPKIRSAWSPKGDDARSRQEYQFNRLKNPVTGLIPDNIRELELKHVADMPRREDLLYKTGGLLAESWQQRGPYNVGGRTRALAIDLNFNGTSNKRILAGGISGGIFRSDDDGSTWSLRTSLDDFASVTAIAQDPASRNTWYYSTGEYSGNSARGGGAAYYGNGLFKSTDNGESWSALAATVTDKPNSFDSFFDFVQNVAVHQTNGDLFVAAYSGIYRSQDSGNSFSLMLGDASSGPFAPMTDVVAGSDGSIVATISNSGSGNTYFGVYRSTDSGNNWTKISPVGLVADPHRMVTAISPSNPNIVYLLVQSKQGGAVASDHQFFKYNAASGSWTDLSSNIPNESGLDGNASFSSQGGYDLVVKVKPDNENTVWIGGTNIYRSTNGGSAWTRVGGYSAANTYALYENHHSDVHAIVFYPNNNNKFLCGDDGGIQRSENALAQPHVWTPINNGYVTSQFYAAAIDPDQGDLIIGGLQDNGTWGTETSNATTAWENLFSGDGAYTGVSTNSTSLYYSSQKGNVVRSKGGQLSTITPAGGSNFLFIAPFVLDPNDTEVMYMAADNAVWRNSNLSGIPNDSFGPTSKNWTKLSSSAIAGTQVTALTVSKSPANRLVFGSTDYQSSTKIIRVDNPASNGSGTDITPVVAGGANPSSIAINPTNADEMVVVFSNYGIDRIFGTTNGGSSWTVHDASLAGANGPSVRWVTILPTASGTLYVIGTSTGVYSTSNLAGGSTVWAQEGADTIGNVVVDMVLSRQSDGLLVAATHGRGVYSANVGGGGGGTANATTNVNQINVASQPNSTGANTFTLSNTGTANLTWSTSVANPSAAAKSDQSAVNSDRTAVIYNNQTAVRAQNERGSPKNNAGISGEALSIKNTGLSPVLTSVLGTDYLWLDDGDATADLFYGFGNGNDFYATNYFTPAVDYSLEALEFYIRTEGAATNIVEVSVFDENDNELVNAELTYGLMTDGGWFAATLNSPINFTAGSTFSVEIGSKSGIGYPTGIDTDASVTNNSWYYDWGTAQWVNLNTDQTYPNSAFLIRAKGTAGGGGGNAAPTANISPSNTTANVNESISFDGSGSSDSDGSIASYAWNFGDGATATGSTANHAWTSPGSKTVTLTVTDNQGATGQTTQNITINGTANGALSVSPSSGTLAPGESTQLTVTFDASGVANGNYSGTVTINSNGGTIPVTVSILVATDAANEDENLPARFTLDQNYPNPFNPTTTIPFTLTEPGFVTLSVYDITGRLVKNLITESRSTGAYDVVWNGQDASNQSVASGTYIVQLKVNSAGGNVIKSQKIVLLK